MAGTPARIGPYQIIGEIGRGGMGVVLRAKDPSLERDLAIKVLAPGASQIVRERFLREGRTCGRLRHPHIVSVYAAGVDGETAYLAQDLIEGQSLAEHLDAEPMTATRAANVVERIARALHYAHGEGVIHRDVKPANILLDTAGLPHLADFGLARDIESSEQLSKSGEVLGTPHYVSPEQGSGQLGRVDGRTDIWACGIVLYECLAGVPPFDGDSAVGVLRNVIHGEPAPLSRKVAGVPRPLELIVNKCLEKDPERRYRSAELLADDLARFQRGEPVHARAPSAITQVKRFLLRRRIGSVALVLGLAALGVGFGVAVPAMRASESASLQRLQEVSSTSLDAALALRRAGDLAGARQFAERVETACATALEALPDSAEPHYQLGRMYRVLQRDDEALAAQSRALAADANHLGARYERLVLGVDSYVDRLIEASQQVARELADAEEEISADEADRRYSTEALVAADPAAAALYAQLLDDLTRVEAGFRELGAGTVRCAQGLRAWAEDDLEAAREHLEAAIAADPGLSTAYEMLGRVELEDGNEAEAVACLTRGLERDRANLRMLAARTRARTLLIEDLRDDDEDPSAEFAGALQDADAWLAHEPDRPEALRLRSRIRREFASHRRDEGVYEPAGYEGAVADADRVLARYADDAPAWALRGKAHMNWAYTARIFKQDAIPLYEAAVDDFSRAIEFDAGDDDALRYRARVHREWGKLIAKAGADPGAHYTAALADLDSAARIDPARSMNPSLASRVHRLWGDHLHRQKSDPNAQYALAVAKSLEACTINPDWEYGARRLLYSREAWIEARRERAESADAIMQQALDGIADAEQRWPDEGDWPKRRGRLFLDRAAARPRADVAGQRADFTAAIAAISRAITLDPETAKNWSERARATNNRALDLDDPAAREAGFRAAIADYTQAIALDPERYYLRYLRGRAQGNLARVLAQQGADPTPAFRAARDDYDTALQMDPDSSSCLRERPKLYEQWLRYLETHDATPEAVIPVLRGAVDAMREEGDRRGPMSPAQRIALQRAAAMLRDLESR